MSLLGTERPLLDSLELPVTSALVSLRFSLGHGLVEQGKNLYFQNKREVDSKTAFQVNHENLAYTNGYLSVV